MNRILLLVLALVAFAPGDAEAQRRCSKGIPCGNTCIAATKTCRVGSGTATAAPRSAPAPAMPEGTRYVASRQGRVYYNVACSNWRSLVPANRIYFESRAKAEEAGYTPSTAKGCGPVDDSDD